MAPEERKTHYEPQPQSNKRLITLIETLTVFLKKGL